MRMRVEAAKLECGNGIMNDQMRNALEADANPVIMPRPPLPIRSRT